MKHIERQYSQRHFFNYDLEYIIDRNNSFIILLKLIDWKELDKKFSNIYKSHTGRPGLNHRFMIGLHMIQYLFGTSDRLTLALVGISSELQYFVGLTERNQKLCSSSSMSRWRKRVSVKELQAVLKETVRIAANRKIITKKDFENITVDSTIQEKRIKFPTDLKLYHDCRKRLVDACKSQEIPLKRTFKKKSKQDYTSSIYLYTEAKKNKTNKERAAESRKKAKAYESKVKGYLDSVIKDAEESLVMIEETIEELNKTSQLSLPDDIDESFFDKKKKAIQKFRELLDLAKQISARNESGVEKIYSLFAKEVKFFTKHGKKYYGNKVSVVTNRDGTFVLCIVSYNDTRHDCKTLKDSVEKTEELVEKECKVVLVDKGYKGKDNHPKDKKVLISGAKNLSEKEKKLLKKRSSVETVIGHMKQDHKMSKNRLLGEEGDAFNSFFSGIAKNLKKIMNDIEKDRDRKIFDDSFDLSFSC